MTMRRAAAAITLLAAAPAKPCLPIKGGCARPAAEPGWEMIMPTQIGRDELPRLTGQGAQLVKVQPAADYDRAHPPGAVSIP